MRNGKQCKHIFACILSQKRTPDLADLPDLVVPEGEWLTADQSAVHFFLVIVDLQEDALTVLDPLLPLSDAVPAAPVSPSVVCTHLSVFLLLGYRFVSNGTTW